MCALGAKRCQCALSRLDLKRSGYQIDSGQGDVVFHLLELGLIPPCLDGALSADSVEKVGLSFHGRKVCA